EAPVPRPGKVLAVGVNYKDHAEEAKIPLPERPIIFAKMSSCVIGTGAPIHRQRVSTKLDFEGELCVVIGKHARHVAAADADACVAGYMVGNDVSVRDWQFHSPTWVMGKSFDTHGPTGPLPHRTDGLGCTPLGGPGSTAKVPQRMRSSYLCGSSVPSNVTGQRSTAWHALRALRAWIAEVWITPTPSADHPLRVSQGRWGMH